MNTHAIALALAATVVAACLVPGPRVGPIAAASLTVEAPTGHPTGRLTVVFAVPTRVYYSKRWGLAATTNLWFVVEFDSDTAGRFHLVYQGATPLWPQEDDVREYRGGEVLAVPFAVGGSPGYRLASAAGEVIERLPPGNYRVSAKLAVPDVYPARRCRLTIFEVMAPPIDLVVH